MADQIVAIRRKMRHMGVCVDQPTNIFRDNMSGILNLSSPESTLKRKHNQICFQCVREAVAAKIIRIGYVDSKNNLADVLTKNLPWASRKRLVYEIFCLMTKLLSMEYDMILRGPIKVCSIVLSANK